MKKGRTETNPGKLKLSPPPADWRTYPTEILDWPVQDPPKPRLEHQDLHKLADLLNCELSDLEPWTAILWGILYTARLAPISRRTLRNPTAAQLKRIRIAAKTIRQTADEMIAANAALSLTMMLEHEDAGRPPGDEGGRGPTTLDDVMLAIQRLEDAAWRARRREKASLRARLAGTMLSRSKQSYEALREDIDRRVNEAASAGLTDDGETPRPSTRAIDHTVMYLAMFFEKAVPDVPLPTKSSVPRTYEVNRGVEQRISANLFLRFAVAFLRLATPDDPVSEHEVLGAFLRGKKRVGH